MKNSSIKLALLSSVCLTSTLVSVPTLAQDKKEVSLEEITVTARRREERLQDAPVAITAFSSTELELRGMGDITELAQSAPNMVLEPSRASNGILTAFIRGVGQQDPLAGFEPGVGIYVDDVYLARPQGTLLEILDVERIEVLRGPQGTLYGRNAMGGAIKYVTKKLSDELTGKLSARFGSYKQMEFAGAISGPLSETFRVGIAATKLDRGGYGKNINLDKDNYDKDIFAVRVTAEIDAAENIFFRMTTDYTHDKSNPKHGHRLIVGGTTGAPVLDDVYDTRAGADENYVSSGIDGNNEVTNKGASGQFIWEVNENLTVKTITAYREDYTNQIIDFDSLPGDQMDAAVIYTNRQFTQELQVNYDTDKMNLVAGLYYINADATNDFDLSLGALGPIGTYTGGDFKTKSWSAFMDLTYDFTEQFSLSVGGRYTHDRRSANVKAGLIAGLPSPALGGSAITLRPDSDYSASKLNEKFTPRVLLNYKPNENLNLYATYSQGFKAGNYDPRSKNLVPGGEAVTKGYDPETLHNFELGMKSTWMDGRAMTNIAAFYADLKDMQVAGSVPIDTNNDGIDDNWAGLVTNAGKASIKGIEVEGKFAVTDNFLLTGSLAMVDANINEWIVNGVDISGSREMQNTPEYTANVTARYTQDTKIGSLNYILSWNGVGNSHQFETPQPAYDQPAYGLWNASIVWNDADGKYTVGVYGKNLTNKRYITSGYDFLSLSALIPEGVLTAFYGAPRTVTLSVGMNF